MVDVILVEFAAPEPLLRALDGLRQRGVRLVDVYSPYPVEELDHLLGSTGSRLPFVVLAAGLFGAGFAYFLQWFLNAYDYPLDVGGRPPHMPTAFVPITFEMGVLSAGIAAFLGVFALAGLPHLSHPVFALEGFRRASIDRFWLAFSLAGTDISRDSALELVKPEALQVIEPEGGQA